MLLRDKIVALLPHVSKPIQYVGQELNAVRKPWAEVRIKVGLCFPDAYEIGMSHLGLHLLYTILNAQTDVVAERFYAPFPDMEVLMRQHGIPLFSLESHRSAAEFDILGFTLQYELSYSNILNMLSLADIPLKSEERSSRDPLIIAGGPCSYNPEPLAEIVDLFVIGDGERTISTLVNEYHDWKESGGDRQELLRQLCRLPGIYVPAFYEVRYGKTGQVTEIIPTTPEAPDRIQRAIVPDLDSIPYLQAPVVPYLRPVHDRLTLEIMRGCARGCRFCQAGYIYRPLRERSLGYLLFLAKSLLAESGYDEVSLSSLSTGDYAQITSLVAAMMEMCEASKVSVSLPSMRVKTLTEQIASIIRRVRKTGFTIAPEAGTQRLRNVINKGISDEDVLQTVEEAFSAGWELLKLYFMIGLPTETDTDLEGLIDLVYQAQKVARRTAKQRNLQGGTSKAKLHVSLSSFVPKAHTPFQWEPMMTRDAIMQKQQILKERIRHRAIQLKWHHSEASYLEGIFARGDRRLNQVLCEAHRMGCKFDAWDEHFNFSTWMDVFARVGIDPDFYVARTREENEFFPWEHIDTGISKNYLWNERLKGLRAEGTPPCEPHCRRCGLCTDEVGVIRAKGDLRKREDHQMQFPDSPAQELSRSKAFRVRAVYEKTGILRFLSHLDLGRVFQRAISRTKAPIAYSQGFHPHPQIAFGPALPVGTEGQREYVDFYFSEQIDIEHFITNMNATFPEGVRLHEGSPIDPGEPSLSSTLKQFVFEVYIPVSLVEQGYDLSYFTRYAREFHERETFPVRQLRKKIQQIDIKQCIVALDVQSGEAELPRVQMIVQTHLNITIKPEDVLRLIFCIPDEKVLDCRIVRMSSY